MTENITSSRRKATPVWVAVLGGLCLILLILSLLCRYFLRIINPSPTPAPDLFPITDIVYGDSHELGFVNADGSDATTFSFSIERKTMNSTWSQPFITGDSKNLVVTSTGYGYPGYIGSAFVAHAGEVAVDCEWWGVVRLASDQMHILVETEQGLEEYSPDDCGTSNVPERVYSEVFGALSPDEQYSAEGRPLSKGGEPNIIIRQLKTGEERIIGDGDFPAWSRDGQWLAYTGKDGIYIIQNSPNAESRRLVTLEGPEPSIGIPVYHYYRDKAGYYPPIVSWSPDGQWLVYHVYNEHLAGSIFPGEPSSIFKVNVITGEEIKIIDGGISPSWRWPVESQK